MSCQINGHMKGISHNDIISPFIYDYMVIIIDKTLGGLSKYTFIVL